ncbi:WD repeat-containing protein 11-like [Cloeon dipterum]|uniref:WD repeat-containing protein 11-like n=1 Tax=Cloeon dipterum TaxID=197152 RepID=UPI003220611E
MGESEQDGHLERQGSVESYEQARGPTYNIPKVSARTLVGAASTANIGALEWGAQGLLAYGSNCSVVVLDTRNIQPVQTLEKHKHPVQKICWEPGSIQGKTAGLFLASADSQGHIIVWDVQQGKAAGILQEGSKAILDMAWVKGNNGVYFLAALHQPCSLIIWDTSSKAKLWKKNYNETLLSFSLDPFNNSKLAFLCQDCILFVDDFTVSKAPASNGRRFFISQGIGGQASGGHNSNEKKSGGEGLRKLVKDLVIGEVKPKSEDVPTGGNSDCLQLCYHRSLRHHLLLLFPKELLILDLHINQTVCVVPLERTAAPFLQVVSSRQRDVIFCLHEYGSIGVKTRKRNLSSSRLSLDLSNLSQEGFQTQTEPEMIYDQRCHSEAVRLTKSSKVLGMAIDPQSECRAALILTNGKVIFLDLGYTPVQMGTSNCLSNLIEPYYSQKEMFNEGNLKLQITGLLHSISGSLQAIRMCPALTTRNWQEYQPIMAGGTESGCVQIYNMATGILEKELVIHSYPVRGIEWTGLKSFLSFAFSTPGSSGMVRNELLLSDVATGGCTCIRTDVVDEPPIDTLKVSPLKQYFVLSLKFSTFELWDLRNMCILRTMPKKFPLVTALEWSPIHNLKALRRKMAHQEEKEQEDTQVLSPTAAEQTRIGESSSEKSLIAREHFVFTDTDSQLFHFSVDGNVMKDGIKIPPETGVSGVTCIAFKNDLIVQGDSDGLLNIWDLKARSSRNVHTSRGWVKKMRFAPGKGNLRLLLLYNDGVDIIDLKKAHYERIAQLKSPRDIVKVSDIDWAASDKPVLATQDGCLRVMDISLTHCSSPMAEYSFENPIYCPSLLTPHALLTLRTSLATNLCTIDQLDNLRGLTDLEAQGLKDQIAQLSDTECDSFRQKSYCKRALAAAKYFGSDEEVDLWTVADYYINVYKRTGVMERSPSLDSPGSTLDTNRTNAHPDIEPLDTCFDLICDNYSFQKLQLERAAFHESKRGDYEHTKKVIERLILLGQTDRAVQLLLETELENPAYYTDAIKACLVSTIQSTGAAQSTIKLVATNLIANGNIGEGVQLLCLIGKGLDACRYLTSYALWERAAWLAKSVLPQGEMAEVLKKWAEHLGANGNRMQAALVFLSLGRFTQCAELLVSKGLPAQAWILLAACKEGGLTVEPPRGLFEELSQLFEGNQRLLTLFSPD